MTQLHVALEPCPRLAITTKRDFPLAHGKGRRVQVQLADWNIQEPAIVRAGGRVRVHVHEPPLEIVETLDRPRDRERDKERDSCRESLDDFAVDAVECSSHRPVTTTICKTQSRPDVHGLHTGKGSLCRLFTVLSSTRTNDVEEGRRERVRRGDRQTVSPVNS